MTARQHDSITTAIGQRPAVEAHLPFVRHLAAHMMHWVRPYLELDDLVAIGVEALLRSAERYDPGRGISFRSFAYLRVRGAMCESLGKVGPLPRGVTRRRPGRPARKGAQFSVLRFDERRPEIGGADGLLEDAVPPAIDAARFAARLPRALALLGEPHRQIILRHYFGGDTLDTIGRALGRSRSWASRAHSRALASLRAALEPTLRGC